MIINIFSGIKGIMPERVEIDKVFEEIRTNDNLPIKKDRRLILYTTNVIARQTNAIKNYTGLLFIDIDKCEDAKGIKDFFIAHPHTVATWYSASGNVHCLIKVPIAESVEEFKNRYRSYVEVLDEDLTGCEIDMVTANPIQAAFINYDPDIYINPDPVTFIGIKPVEVKRKVVSQLGEEVSFKKEEWTVNWMKERFNEIVTNGYPQVRALSKTVGGWCATSKIREEKALEVFKEVISDNDYLSGTISQGSVDHYIKVSEGAFKAGLLEPLDWMIKNRIRKQKHK